MLRHLQHGEKDEKHNLIFFPDGPTNITKVKQKRNKQKQNKNKKQKQKQKQKIKRKKETKC